MKILVFSDYFHPHVGGVERVIREISRRLAALGHTIHIVTLNTAGAPRLETFEGAVVHRAKAAQLTRLLGVQSTISAEVFPFAARIARELRPDVIHAHNLFFSTSLIAGMVKRLVGRPMVTTLHLGAMDSLEGKTRLAVRLYERSVGKLLLRGSERTIAVSHAVARHAAQLGCRPERIRVIPNGVDLSRFRPAPLDFPQRRPPQVAFVGRLIFNKGPQFLVQAAPLVLAWHPGTRFVVAGDGPLLQPLRREVERRGLSPAFDFLGQRTDVEAVLREASLLVRPSLSEGLPLTVLEAMACGLPVVATPVGGTAEVVQDGTTGYLVEPGSPEQLGGAICRLLDAPQVATAMGTRGRSLVEEEYTWDRAAEQTLRAYQEVAGS